MPREVRVGSSGACPVLQLGLCPVPGTGQDNQPRRAVNSGHVTTLCRSGGGWCARLGRDAPGAAPPGRSPPGPFALDPLAAHRPHLELYIRWMQEIRRCLPRPWSGLPTGRRALNNRASTRRYGVVRFDRCSSLGVSFCASTSQSGTLGPRASPRLEAGHPPAVASLP
jgi:hypothetical protein